MSQIKIKFSLEQDEDGYPPFDSENIWAMELSGGGFQIDNIPFYAKDATFGDVVDIECREGSPVFSRVLRYSGNSLVRIKFYDSSVVESTIAILNEMGCEAEINDNVSTLVALHIPSKVSFKKVIDFLIDGSDKDLWDYEEALVWDQNQPGPVN